MNRSLFEFTFVNVVVDDGNRGRVAHKPGHLGSRSTQRVCLKKKKVIQRHIAIVELNKLGHTKDYCITGRANVIFCAVGLR